MVKTQFTIMESVKRNRSYCKLYLN